MVMNTQEKNEKYLIGVSKTELEREGEEHIAPSQTADTLFNFMDERKYLEKIRK